MPTLAHDDDRELKSDDARRTDAAGRYVFVQATENGAKTQARGEERALELRVRGRERWQIIAGLVGVTALGVAVRVFGLTKGLPYHHFHADESFAVLGTNLLTNAPDAAAQSLRFFVYPALPKYLHGILVDAYEWAIGPLYINLPADQTTFILIGRGISAALGSATVPVTFFIARRVAGNGPGLLAAALTAGAVLHIAGSRFFTADIPLTFFCATALWAFIAVADSGR